jgi:hypothetical protein
MADALRLCTRGAGSNCNDSGSRWERGAYAVQFAARAGLHVVAVTKKETDYVRSLGAEIVLDSQIGTFEKSAPPVDVLIDTVGGETSGTLACFFEARGSSRLGRLYRSATLSPGCALSLLLCRGDNGAPELHFKVV